VALNGTVLLPFDGDGKLNPEQKARAEAGNR
jgi:hypothetical protein